MHPFKVLGVAMLLASWPGISGALEDRADEFMWKCEGLAGDNEFTNLLGKVWCVAYLDGILDAAVITQVHHPRALPICAPESGVSGDQARLVFIKWAKDHPAKLHLSARVLAVAALLEAFPC